MKEDMEAKSVIINGLEVSKLASITIHPTLRQGRHATAMRNDKNHALIQWIMAACKITLPNKSHVPVNTGLWTLMEKLQNFIITGNEETIYDDTFESTDLV